MTEMMPEMLEGKRLFRDSRFPFHIDRVTIERGHSIPLHTHDFTELVFVVSGSAFHSMEGSRRRLAAGDVFVLEPSVYHSYEASPDEEAVVCNVLFDTGFLRSELEGLQHIASFVKFFYLLPFMRRSASFVKYQALAEGPKRQVEANFDYMLAEYTECREGWQLLIKTRLIETLVWLSRFLEAAPAQTEERRNAGEWVESVRHFLEMNAASDISLAQISRMCGMSVSTFTAKFKEATGRSLLAYRHELQIGRACALLADTDRKILDIAHETGFNDISFFNKQFRKYKGMTPGAYRRLRR